MIIMERQSAFRRCVMSASRLHFNFHFVFISLPAFAINAPRERERFGRIYGTQDTRLLSGFFGYKADPAREWHIRRSKLEVSGSHSEEL